MAIRNLSTGRPTSIALADECPALLAPEMSFRCSFRLAGFCLTQQPCKTGSYFQALYL